MAIDTLIAGKVLVMFGPPTNGFPLFYTILSALASLGMLVTLCLICDDKKNRTGILTTSNKTEEIFLPNSDELVLLKNSMETSRFTRGSNMSSRRSSYYRSGSVHMRVLP